MFRTILITCWLGIILLCGCFLTLTHLHLKANLVVIDAAQLEYEAARLIIAVDAYVDWQENDAPIFTSDLLILRQYLLDRRSELESQMLEETND